MIILLKSLFEFRFVLLSLVRQDLKNKYRNSILGIGWSLLYPLGLVAIIGVVYSQLMGQPLRDFIPYLFSGLIPWMFITQCADGGTMTFLNAEGYIKQTRIPVIVFPLRTMFGSFIQLMISLSAFLLIILFINIDSFNFKMLLVIPAMCLWLILGVSITIISGLVNTYFRDFIHIQSLLLQGLFYATPIVFPAEMLRDGNFEWLYQWNPIYYILEIIRRPLLGEFPSSNAWIIASVIIISAFLTAITLMKRVGRKITFRL
ncbi:ABC transporter permease [Paenibacillus sp. FSL F4-0125]|uniref:ABC transporter permease n=1 Tax=Paenibacillus sp. FSL F4-0125 TaxID=2954730 RepID=UPI0030F8E8F4